MCVLDACFCVGVKTHKTELYIIVHFPFIALNAKRRSKSEKYGNKLYNTNHPFSDMTSANSLAGCQRMTTRRLVNRNVHARRLVNRNVHACRFFERIVTRRAHAQRNAHVDEYECSLSVC